MNFSTDYKQDELEKFLATHPKSHFMQSLMWTKIKDNWQHEFVVAYDDKKIVGAMLILIHKLPLFNTTLMYAPRGPVCDIHNKEVFEGLINKAKELAKKYNAYSLKIDPDILISDTEFSNMVKDMGFIIKNKDKDFEGIQPRFAFRINNIKDKSEEEILMSFNTKTRYNIRLADKKKIEIKLGSRKELKDFHKIMLETAVKDEFVTRPIEYYEKMYNEIDKENLRLYMAYLRGRPIAGTLAILYGNKCWYLYGASSNSPKNVIPHYRLQWEMIKWAHENKCDIYDFRGISGKIDERNPLYGLYRFKKGFNGDYTEFIGELELVFNPAMKFFVDIITPIFKFFRKKILIKQ